MKFAIVDGVRREAERELRAKCVGCGRSVVAKRGERDVDHWAHVAFDRCDPWSEDETAWHRAWKDQFPEAWQEVICGAPDGERHIADVRTAQGWVVEFQHAGLGPEQRRAREAFYPKLLWVVDCTRRCHDVEPHAAAWRGGSEPYPASHTRFPAGSERDLLRDWRGSRAHVFFDFGDPAGLWWLFAGSSAARTFIRRASREQFVDTLHDDGTHAPTAFDLWVQNVSALNEFR